MEDIEIGSWDEFPDALKQADQLLAGTRREYSLPDELLYRGVADVRWELSTTLERRLEGEEMTSEQYVMHALQFRREVEAISGRRWNAPVGLHEIRKEIAEREQREIGRNPFQVHLPAYAYLVYLRQHGFASPLLDWTQSPYIAAFFAFFQPQHGDEGRAAIHVFSERPDGIKGGRGSEHLLQVWGPFTETHKRHFVQQAIYTTATRWDYDRQCHLFVPHNTVIGQPDRRQDMRVRITIPRSERTRVLKWLNGVNINSYTLFQTEDSLVQAIDSRVFDLGWEEVTELKEKNRLAEQEPEPPTETS